MVITVATITPGSGPATGGTPVTITGSGYWSLKLGGLLHNVRMPLHQLGAGVQSVVTNEVIPTTQESGLGVLWSVNSPTGISGLLELRGKPGTKPKVTVPVPGEGQCGIAAVVYDAAGNEVEGFGGSGIFTLESFPEDGILYMIVANTSGNKCVAKEAGVSPFTFTLEGVEAPAGAPPATVTIGNAATAVVVLSDTELTATTAATAGGSYEVVVDAETAEGPSYEYFEGFVGGALSPGSPFTYPAWDLLTLDALDPLPYTSVGFGRELNRAGAWSGQLLISDPRVQELDYLGASNTGCTALFVDYLGTLIWGGVLWTRRYNETSKTLRVTAQEFGSYFAQRLQAKDYATTWEGEEHSEDPMVIAETILNDAQNREAEPDVAPAKIMLGIAIIINRHEPGAPPVNASYPGTQLQTIDSIISTLSQMGYKAGFDYSFDVAYLHGTKTPAVTLNFWYPTQGRSAEEANITIGPQDCQDWNYDEDSSKQADLVVETGTGSGGLQPVRASAAPPGYPLLEKATSHSQVNNEGVLAGIAFGELAQTVYPVTTPWLILPIPMPDPQGHVDPAKFTFGDFELGDELTFRVDPVSENSMNSSPRFPNGMKFTWRISNWTCAVADKGISTLTFNLSIPPVGESEIPPPKPPLR